MSKWPNRSGLYQGTLVLIYLTFLVYGLAFSVPTWFGTSSAFQGLWLSCVGGSDHDFQNCTTVAFGDDNSAWMDGVRGVWVAGTFLFLVAVVYSVVENCCAGELDKDYGITGFLTLLAGACGAAGVITVAVKTADVSALNTYRWGYILACISSGLALILSIVLLIAKSLVIREKQPRNARTADYVFAHKQPYSTEYTNQGFTRDDIPLANGVTYHHTPQPGPYNMYRGGESYPTAPYQSNSLQRNGTGYQPYGYDMGRPNQRLSVAESADLSNGYTTELIQAEHTLGRSQVARSGDYGRSGDFGRGADYPRNDYNGRNDYYLNGGGRF